MPIIPLDEFCVPIITFQAVQGALLSCAYAVLDYAQTGLIAAVFFFKVSMFHSLMMIQCASSNMFVFIVGYFN